MKNYKASSQDLKTPTLDERVKIVGKALYARDINESIEKRREDSRVSSINTSGHGNKRTKTLYEK